ncbi:MAG: chromosomal replication initiator DnaA [Caulobacter sp.]|nr:chromosomal replication initiator DnaA [Caulobacter sp.]
MPAQFRLPFEPATVWTRDAFVLSDANRSAVMALDDWAALGRGALALVGPAGSGKSHLAHAWSDANGAALIFPGRPATLEGSGPVLVEDADMLGQDEVLFHLLNQALAGRAVLLTARERPLTWPTALPDLRSRLNALTVAEIAPPDDAQLRAVLEALFKARHIKPEPDLYPYLQARMERSVAAARILVSRMDEAAAARGRAINRALARELLEETSDLFDDEAFVAV